MVKIIMLLSLSMFSLLGNEKLINSELERDCLKCHKDQSIPSEVIYRRYLMKYSSKETIREMMLAYLKAPSVESSIMPPQFFSKFPIKEMPQMKEEVLRKRIDEYIDYFDINKRLFIPEENN